MIGLKRNEALIYSEMKEKLDLTKFDLVTEGLSDDKKFCVETSNGKRLLLRVSNISEYERKKTIFDIMKKVDDLGVPMCRPVDFGICNDGKNVYQLLTWCEGVNAESVLSSLPETEQYVVGKKAGEILRTIHSIQAPHDLNNWQERYFSENDSRIKAFFNCDIQIDSSDILFNYVENNKELLNNRPQCLQHGDYHVGNLMITDRNDVSVIDWELLDFDNYADPWNEFSSIGLSDVRPCFTTGLIRGYFRGEPPIDFWKLLAFYLAAGALMLVPWAYYSQHEELMYATQHVKDVLSWFDNFNTIMPRWYIQGREG
jgi:aminoglycoside phosphotransferase (APT) family kinase protein